VSATRIDDFHPHVNGAVNPLFWTWLEEKKQTARDIAQVQEQISRQHLRRFIGRRLKEPINPILDSERDYQAEGLSTISIPYQSKARVTAWKEFQQRQSTDAFSPESNIAIVCGAVSGNLAVIDSETQTDFNWVRSELESRGINTWTVRTARGGHCYVRTREPISGRILKLDGREIEIRGDGQYVLAPPSIHPSGIAYQFLNRPSEIARVTFEQLRFLGVRAPAVATAATPADAKRTERVPPSVWRRLQKRCPEYSTRNKQDASTILSLILLGRTKEQILELFEKHPATGRYLEDKKEFLTWFERAYISARRKAEAGDSEATRRTRAEISRLLQMVATMRWKGRGAINARRALLACLEIALEVGNVQFNASELRISEISMIKVQQTVSNALRRLQALGYITLLQSGKGTNRASTYRLELSEIQKEAQNGNVPSSIVVGTLQIYACFLNELFSAKALPSSSQEIYESLGYRGPMTSKQLCGSGRGIDTVRRALKAMLGYELIRKQRRLYEINVSCDLEKLARRLEVENARDELREKHQTLREKRFDKKSGKLKTEALKVALETGDVEMQRFILCPTSGVVQ
jgi:DNA-binding transcriptional ArsR family regulator